MSAKRSFATKLCAKRVSSGKYMTDANKIILAVIIIAALGIIYLFARGMPANNLYPTPTPSETITPTPTPTSTPTPTKTPASASTATPSASPRATATPASVIFNISAVESKYTPSAITANAGQKITIKFTNNGTTPHNLTFEDISVATKTINPGQTDTIQFTAPEAGNYTFFCTIDSHRELGLTGMLIVQ